MSPCVVGSNALSSRLGRWCCLGSACSFLFGFVVWVVAGQFVSAAVAHVFQQFADILAGFVKSILCYGVPIWDHAAFKTDEVYGVQKVLQQCKLGVVYALGSFHVSRRQRGCS